MAPLPMQVRNLFAQLDASSRLVAHLTLVHDVALQLTAVLDRVWPGLSYDREAVLLGAATHDIGKVLHPHELSGPGRRHENAGVALLIQYGFPPQHAQFARTHGEWRDDPASTLEDLLVALADKIWRGKRDAELEDALVRYVAGLRGQEPWEVYVALDDVVRPIAQQADARLVWQAHHPLRWRKNETAMQLQM